MEMQSIGRIAFYIGLVLSIVAGWVQVGKTGLMVLVGLGLLVGLLNITAKESHDFLLATLVLISAGFGLGTIFGGIIERILFSFVAFTAAAALVVALKEVYKLERA